MIIRFARSKLAFKTCVPNSAFQTRRSDLAIKSCVLILILLPTKVVLRPAPAATRTRKDRWADLQEEERERDAEEEQDTEGKEEEQDTEEKEKEKEKEEEEGNTSTSTPLTHVSGRVAVFEAEAGRLQEHADPAALKPLSWDMVKLVYPRGHKLWKDPDLRQKLLEHPPSQPAWRKTHNKRGLQTSTDVPLPKDTPWTLAARFAPGPVVTEMVPTAKRPRTDDPPLYRFCSVEQRLRHQHVQSASSGMVSAASLQLSISTWNGGAWRGAAKSMDNWRCGAFHVIIGQEVEGRDLEEEGGNSEIQLHRFGDAGFTCYCSNFCMIGARLGDAEITKVRDFADDRDLCGLIAKVRFLHGHAGITELVVASMHLHNKQAKKTQVSYDACMRFLRCCIAAEVDIIGVDINQGYERLVAVLRELGGGVVIKPPGADDCVSLVAPPASRLLKGEPLVCVNKFYNILPGDMQWQATDADSHWLVATHIRKATGRGLRQRGAAGAEHRKRQDAARKARKKAATAASSGSKPP